MQQTSIQCRDTFISTMELPESYFVLFYMAEYLENYTQALNIRIL